MNKFFNFTKKLIINILILPYTILKLINNVFNNNLKKVKFSIKKKITYNYITLYVISCIFTLVIVISGYFCLEYKIFIPKKIATDETLLRNCNTQQELINTIKSISFYRDSDIIVTELDNTIIYSNDSSVSYKTYPQTKLKLFEFLKEYKQLPYKDILSLDSKFYKIFYYFNLQAFTHRASILAILVSSGELFGLIIIWIFGSLKSKKVLQPIYTMTTMAKDITINNMDC